MVGTIGNTIHMHNSFCAFYSAKKSSGNFDITAETEFCFWDSIESIDDDHASDSSGGGQTKTHDTEARGGQAKIACYPQVWPLMETSKDHDSTVQPCIRNHYLSPNSQKQVIADGRKMLMQAIEDWSEWNLELPLKDIVDEERVKEVMHGDITKEHRSTGSVRPAEFRKQQKNSKRSQIYGTGKIKRLESMDRENFLIKMLFPSFRYSKKKSDKEENGTPFCLIPKFKDSAELVRTKSWSQRRLLSGTDQSSDRSSSKKKSIGSTSISTMGRFNEDTQTLGCWPFSGTIKGRSRSRSFVL